MKQLGEIARQLRLGAGLNQVEMARLIGSSQPNVSAAEAGKGTRYARVAITMIELLGNSSVLGPFYALDTGERED